MPIRLENVYFTYNAGTPMAREALFGVNLEIDDGEFVGLIGHTGSGKSTLIQHFNGLVRPTSGRVLIDGVDITDKKIGLRPIRQKVGMVFQYPEHQLFGETVFEDVAFGPQNIGVPEGEIEERVREALNIVDLDLDQLRQRSPFELSGGQKRRVAIAGVLAMRPSILVLDEPTAGLDPRGRDQILAQIKKLHRQRGLTVILVTHNMEDIARLAQRLVVMEKGRVVLDGPPSDVFAHVDQLHQIGLGVPQVTTLVHELKKRGRTLRTNVFTLEEAESEIKKLLETRCHGHV